MWCDPLWLSYIAQPTGAITSQLIAATANSRPQLWVVSQVLMTLDFGAEGGQGWVLLPGEGRDCEAQGAWLCWAVAQTA